MCAGTSIFITHYNIGELIFCFYGAILDYHPENVLVLGVSDADSAGRRQVTVVLKFIIVLAVFSE